MGKRWISILLSFMIIFQSIGAGSISAYGETLENMEMLQDDSFVEVVEESSQSAGGDGVVTYSAGEDDTVTFSTRGDDTGDSTAESYVETGVGAAAVTSDGLIEDENVLSGDGATGTGANEAESETELPGTSGAISGTETETELSEAETEGVIEEETETDGLIEDLSLADGEEMEIITVTETVELEDPSVASGRFSASPRTYSLTEYDGCYGNQLSGSTRTLYDARVNYYVSGRNTGDMVLTYSKSTSPYVFDAVVNKDESNKSSIDKTTEEYLAMKEQVLFDIQSSLDAFLYDHPEIFWLRGGKCTYSVSAVGSSASGYVGYVSKMTYTPSVAFDGAEELISAYDAAVAATVSEIVAGADADGDGVTSNLELATAAHDYLCSRLWYDSASYATYQETEDYRIFSSAGAFLNSVGTGVVCEGYAKAYKVLCDQLGISCVLIGGTVVQSSGTIGHMWNAVQIHGEWYLTDVTWDDGSSGISYKYFLVGNITTNRYSSGNFSGAEVGTVFVYPSLETTAFEAVADMLHINVFASETGDECGGYRYVDCICAECGYHYQEYTTGEHDYQPTEVVEPDCTTQGYTIYTCKYCNDSYIGDYKAALGHTYVNGVCSRCGMGDSIANATISALSAQAYTGKAVTPAITVSFGTNVLKAGTDYTVAWSSNKNPGTAYVTITGKGNYSGSVTKSFSITKRSVASLTYSSISNRVYNGKARKPSLTIKNGSVRLTAGQDYTVTYSKNTNVGRAVITVTGKGNYTGTKKVYFNIIPRTPVLNRVRSTSSRKLTAIWKKVAGVTGYQIQYSTSKTFKTCKTVTVNAKNLSKTISKLTGGKAYYVRVRSYKKVSSKNYFSSWSASKKVKVKK